MNSPLLEKVLQSPRLPSLPAIALEVIDLVHQKDIDIKQIAHTISHDPALSGKILKTVNSSFYAQQHAVSTISHALVVLGLNSVKTLALGFSLIPNLQHAGGEGFDHLTFWKRSLYSAVAARTLAQRTGLLEQEEAFLGGLLQDLGMLALAQALGDEYHAIIAAVGTEHRRLWQVERERLGADHAQIGAALAEAWRLPPLLVQPIAFHENPVGVPPDLLPLVRCVVLGSRMADVFISLDPAKALDVSGQMGAEWFGTSPHDTHALLDLVHEQTLEVRKLFDLPMGDLESPGLILARANEALLQMSLQQERQAHELEARNRELTERASTDALTGAANRGRFNAFMTEQFARARDDAPGGTGPGDASGASGVSHGPGAAGPLSVLFLDADHFKRFNDNYGHAVGDRVLIELAAILKRAAPAGALVARYGGEEFAVVLPRTDRVAATRLAERIRQQIEAGGVRSDAGAPLRITASIGVACFDGAFFTRPEQVVKAADQALYAAKSAGRNAVRVFTPRKPAPAQPAAPAPQPQVA